MDKLKTLALNKKFWAALASLVVIVLTTLEMTGAADVICNATGIVGLELVECVEAE